MYKKISHYERSEESYKIKDKNNIRVFNKYTIIDISINLSYKISPYTRL